MSDQVRSPWPSCEGPSLFSKDQTFNGVNKAKATVARLMKESGRVPQPMLSDPKDGVRPIRVYARAVPSSLPTTKEKPIP